MTTSNSIPAVLTFDPPSKQNSLSTERALRNVLNVLNELDNIEAGDVDRSESFEDRLAAARGDLRLMIGAVR